MLSNIDFVDDDVLEKYKAKAKEMREFYGIGSSSISPHSWTYTTPPVVPIEKIRIGPSGLNETSPSITTLCTASNGDQIFGSSKGNRIHISRISDDSVGENRSVILENSIKVFKIINWNFLLVVTDGGQKIFVVNTETSRICAEHVLVDKSICGLVQVNGRFVASTTDGAVYFVTVDFSPTGIVISHQLIVSGNLVSLGQIACMQFSWKFFSLAILYDKALVILKIDDSTPPKVLCKIKNISNGLSGQCWWFKGGLLAVLGDDWIVLERHAEIGDCVYEQKKCTLTGTCVTRRSPNLHVLSESDNIGIVCDDRASMFEISMSKNLGESKWIAKFFQFPITIGGNIISNETGASNGRREWLMVSSATLYSLRICMISEIFDSLLFGEKWIDAIDLAERVRMNEYPDSLTCDATLDIDRLVRSVWEGPVVDRRRWLYFLYLQDGMKILEDVLLDEDVKELVLMLTDSRERLTDISKIPSFIYQRVIRSLTALIEGGDSTDSESAKDRLNRLIVVTIWSTMTTFGTTTFPIDLNTAIRTATIHDLSESIILMHLYLLNEYDFPVKYFFSQPDEGRTSAGLFYIFSILNGLLYPFWEGDIGSISFDAIAARDSVWSYIQEGANWRRILVNRDGFNSVVFDYDFAGRNIVQDNYDDIACIYCIKSAVLSGRLEELLSSNFCGLGEKNFLKYMLRGSINGKIFLKIFDQIDLSPGPENEIVIESVLTTDGLPIDVLVPLFEKKFVQTIGLTPVIDILKSKGRIDVLVLVLEKRGAIDWIVEVMRESSLSLNLVNAFRQITKNSGILFSCQCLAEIWVRIFNSQHGHDVLSPDQDLSWINKIDVLYVAKNCTNMSIVKILVSHLRERQEILTRSLSISAVDVGTEFNDLIRKKDKGKGISSTATICHVCLDPLLGKRTSKKICFFSCGHLAHYSCCEFLKSTEDEKRSVKCPACT